MRTARERKLVGWAPRHRIRSTSPERWGPTGRSKPRTATPGPTPS